MTVIASALIVGGATLVGAKMASNSSKKASDTAAAGSERDIEFQRESRDLARGDQAPYREAGVTALNALMSMTGLGGPVSGGGGGGDGLQPWSTGRQNDRSAGQPAYGNNGSAGQPAGPPGSYSSLEPSRGPTGGEVPTYNQDGSPVSPEDRQAMAYNRLSQLNPEMAERFRTGYISNEGQESWDNIFGKAYGGPIYGRAGGGALYNVNELGPENVFDGGSYTRSSQPKTIPPSNTGYVGRAYGGSLDPQMGVVNPNQGVALTPAGSTDPTEASGMGSGPKNGAGDYVNSNIPDKGGAYQTPQENPGGVEGGYNFMTDPGYEFRREEGTRAIERGAAARGGLLSGGTGRALQRFGQDYASNEYTNVYNRISNIAGLGQVSAGQSGQYAMYAGQGMGTAAAQGAQASAYGQQAQGNAWANAANDIASYDWGGVFKPRTSSGGYDYPYDVYSSG